MVENLSNIITNNLRKVIIEDDLVNKTSLLMEKINFNQQLRQNYNSLSMDIYQKLESFGGEMLKLFMEQEILIKSIIKEINDSSVNQINLEDNDIKRLDKYKANKIYPNLLKLVDFINSKKIVWNLLKDKIISKNLEVKISQEKLTISLTSLKISLILTCKACDVKTNKSNLKLLEQLLN